MWWIKYVSIRKIFFWIFFCALASCQLQRTTKYLPPTAIPRLEMAESTVRKCGDISAYVPDTNHLALSPMKYVRVNVHFVNANDSTQNYNWHRARDFGPKLIEEANTYLARNRKMWLPRGNDTPVLPTRYRYVLTTSAGFEANGGIYCHYDDELFSFVSRGRNRNNYDRGVIKKYGIGLDSIVNLFVMPHHPDSIRSSTYTVTAAGIALGSGVKLSGIFESRKHPNAFRGLVNHEIGHVLGLRHTWNSHDGCDDTPRHSNCWNRTDEPPCDTAASNNLMDYNANQHAWTPCQIGKIHMNFAREGSLARKMLQRNWCTVDENQTLIITDSMVWHGAKDLEGHLVIKQGATLEIRCRVSMPKNGFIRVEPGGKLILRGARLHNACHEDWLGIEVQSEKNKTAMVASDQHSVIENLAPHLISPDGLDTFR